MNILSFKYCKVNIAEILAPLHKRYRQVGSFVVQNFRKHKSYKQIYESF